MTVLAVLMGLAQIASVAMLILIVYEYRRVLRKRRTLWSAITNGHHAARTSTFLIIGYASLTLILLGLGAFITYRVL